MVAAKRPLRVAHVVQGLEVGGLEKLVIELARRADRQIVLPEIVCTDSIGQLASRYPLEVRVSTVRARPGFDWRAVMRLARHFWRSKTDIIHSHNQRAQYLSTLAGLVARVPVLINTRHGMYLPTTRRGTLRRRTLAMPSHAVVAVSSAAHDQAVQVDRIPPSKVRTIVNGTDIAATRLTRSAARATLGLDDDALVIGAVGRLAAEKDYASLVAAFRQVRTQVPHVVAAILGDGPLLRELSEAARAHGCSELRFFGYREDAVALLSAFDMFVQPSLSEGIALAVIEAMAAGLPVIATSVGGNPEALGNGDAGILVPARDIDALASAITALAHDAGRRNRLAEAGRRRAETYFSIEATARAYEQLYLELVRRRGLNV
jgi:glycosyltransferase involved in cell wall biosynthesis